MESDGSVTRITAKIIEIENTLFSSDFSSDTKKEEGFICRISQHNQK